MVLPSIALILAPHLERMLGLFRRLLLGSALLGEVLLAKVLLAELLLAEATLP